MSAVTCLRARDRQESGYKGPALAKLLLLYPETALPFTTKAGSENCTGYYLQNQLETSGVLLFASWHGTCCPKDRCVYAPHIGHLTCFFIAAASLL